MMHLNILGTESDLNREVFSIEYGKRVAVKI